jgi:hypothetical protein
MISMIGDESAMTALDPMEIAIKVGEQMKEFAEVFKEREEQDFSSCIVRTCYSKLWLAPLVWLTGCLLALIMF